MVRFRLLGSLEVVDADGTPTPLRGGQTQLVLAMLLVAARRVVPSDTLLDELWGEDPPRSAAGTLQSYISRLRRALHGADGSGANSTILAWDPPGYRLSVPHGDIDIEVFERLADEGRRYLDAGDPVAARERLHASLELWRGPALLEFADRPFARTMATRLEERRLVAIEDRVAADLQLGQHTALVGELTELTAQHPLREGLRSQLAVALYRAGRQAEALETIGALRRTLRDELGVDPSRTVRELETRILNQDDVLELAAAPAAPATTAATTSATATIAAPVPATPALVGRDRDLAVLLRALDEAEHGTARFAVVEGEPGIGKSRLLEGLAEAAAARGALVVWGRCYEAGAAPALWPWLDVFRGLLAARCATAPTPGSTIDRLLGPTDVTDTLEIADATRFRLYDEVAALFAEAAAHRLIVVFLDDLHWADAASLELLESLTSRLDRARMVIGVAVRELEVGRDDTIVRTLASLTRRSGSRRLHLRGLAESDTAALVTTILQSPPAPAVAAAIHARSDGNPFFAGELARLVTTEAGLPDEELVRRAAVPAGVRDVLRRRLARLGDATSSLLEVAAVLGRSARIPVLAHAAGHDAVHVLTALEPAMRTRLLVGVPEAPDTVRFVHALVREVVLDQLAPLRRAQLHRQAAAAVTAVEGDGDDNAEILAAHLWEAVSLGGRAEAAAALERAGEVAERRLAYDTAEELLERAVRLRRTAGSDPRALEAELLALVRLATVRRVLYGYTRSIEDTPIERAQELARGTGRFDVLVGLLWAEWAGAALACDFAVSEPLAAQLRDLGEASEDPLAASTGQTAWAIQCWHRGRIAEGLAVIDRAAAAGTPPDVGASADMLLEGYALVAGFQVVLHLLAGDATNARERLTELASQQTDVYAATLLWDLAAYAGAIAGDPEWAADAGLRGKAAEGGRNFVFYSANLAMFRAWGLSELGDLDTSLPLFEEQLAAYQATGLRTALPLHRAHYALALARAGRTTDAQTQMGAAFALLEDTQEHWQDALLLMARAALHRHLGAPGADVASLLEAAESTATSQGAHGLARRARLQLEEMASQA